MNERKNIVPPQYENLPSEVVEGLMESETVYTSEEKNRAEKERRQRILDEIRQREIDAIKANEVRKELGLPEVKAEVARPEIEAVDFESVNENQGLQRSQYDQRNMSAEQRGDAVVLKYGKNDWYQEKGRLIEKNIGGDAVQIVLNTETPSHASYVAAQGNYEIGAAAVNEYRQDPELFYSSINHEAAHKEYFNLDEKKQRELADLFVADPRLGKTFRQFTEAIYGDKLPVGGGSTAGEQYLATHDVSNERNKQTLLVPEGQRGLKDVRSVVFELGGKKREVFLGLVVTELASYMSSLQMSEDVFNKVAENGRGRRGGSDPRYDAVKDMFDQINTDPELKKKFDSFGLFKNNNPEFLKTFKEAAESFK